VATPIGLNAKAYRNTGNYNTPTWSEITLISDLTVNPTWEEADASARESRVKQTVKTMINVEITGRLKKKPGDTNYEAIMNAALSDDALDMLVLDDTNTTNNARGWRMDAQIFSVSEDQSMSNYMYEDIRILPSITTNPVKAVLVTGGNLTYSTPGTTGGTFS
jgi:hypothetical protein